MAYAFLAISAIGFGWFIRDIVLKSLIALSRHQQDLRLKTLVAQSGKPLPFQSFLTLVEENIRFIEKSKPLEQYFLYLTRQLQRDRKSVV